MTPNEAKNIYKKKWGKLNPEKVKEAKQKWIDKNRDYSNRWTKNKAKKNRLKVINNLGAKCACCQESIYELLTIDHINGKGEHTNAQRKNLPKTVIKEGIPKDKYQTLCHNCNAAKGHNKICPHNHFSVFNRATWTILV